MAMNKFCGNTENQFTNIQYQYQNGGIYSLTSASPNSNNITNSTQNSTNSPQPCSNYGTCVSNCVKSSIGEFFGGSFCNNYCKLQCQ
jgi:hypothetical protein